MRHSFICLFINNGNLARGSGVEWKELDLKAVQQHRNLWLGLLGAWRGDRALACSRRAEVAGTRSGQKHLDSGLGVGLPLGLDCRLGGY